MGETGVVELERTPLLVHDRDLAAGDDLGHARPERCPMRKDNERAENDQRRSDRRDSARALGVPGQRAQGAGGFRGPGRRRPRQAA